MTTAGFVLAIASPKYRERAEGLAAPDQGRGAIFESAIIRDRLTRDLPAETLRILSVVRALRGRPPFSLAMSGAPTTLIACPAVEMEMANWSWWVAEIVAVKGVRSCRHVAYRQ